MSYVQVRKLLNYQGLILRCNWWNWSRNMFEDLQKQSWNAWKWTAISGPKNSVSTPLTSAADSADTWVRFSTEGYRYAFTVKAPQKLGSPPRNMGVSENVVYPKKPNG